MSFAAAATSTSITVNTTIDDNVLGTAGIYWQTRGDRGPLLAVTEGCKFNVDGDFAITHKDFADQPGRFCVLSNAIRTPLYPRLRDQQTTFENTISEAALRQIELGNAVDLELALRWVPKAERGYFHIKTTCNLSEGDEVLCHFTGKYFEDVRDNRLFNKNPDGRLFFPRVDLVQANKDHGDPSCIFPDWRHVEPKEKNRDATIYEEQPTVFEDWEHLETPPTQT